MEQKLRYGIKNKVQSYGVVPSLYNPKSKKQHPSMYGVHNELKEPVSPGFATSRIKHSVHGGVERVLFPPF